MPLDHNDDLRNDFCDEMNASVNINGPGSFILKVVTTPAATMVLSNPAFDGVPASGQFTLDVTPEPTDTDATGNASPIDAWDFVDGNAKVIFSGDETDITLTKATIAAGDIVKITSFTYIATQ